MAADIFAKILCTYCQEEITNVRIQCNECPEFDLCVQCFSTGAEIGPHKNDHAYKIFDHCAAKICGGKGNWTGKEQLQLLEAMEKYRFNNWDKVSNYVKTRKPEEVRDEYLRRYLDGTIGVATWNEVRHLRPVLPEHTAPDKGPLAPDVTSRLPPLDCAPKEADLIGYIPNRDDYEQEYDPEAETLISSLQLRPSEPPEEIAVKLAHVDMYTRKLRERARRKRIVQDYQLVAKYFAPQRKEVIKTALTKQQKSLRDNMKVFSQFLTSREHERLMENVDRERDLRFRLSELLRYRSLGITTQDEAVHYEQHVAYERQQQLRKKAGSGGFATISQESPSENESEGRSQNSLDKRIDQPLDEEQPESSKNSNSSACDIQPVPLSLLPQGNCLSEHELQLCSSLNILPIQYRILKRLIIQDNILSKNKSKPAEESVPNGGETSIKEVVTKYLKVSGWLPSVSVV